MDGLGRWVGEKGVHWFATHCQTASTHLQLFLRFSIFGPPPVGFLVVGRRPMEVLPASSRRNAQP